MLTAGTRPARDEGFAGSGVELAPSDLERFDSVYESERLRLLIERLRLALTIGAVMYGVFAILDVTAAPQHARLFLSIRGIVMLLSIAVLASSYTELRKRSMEPASIVVLLAASTGITVMTTFLGGFESDYYIGNLLVLFFVGLFMPWKFSVALFFCAFVTGTYVGLNLWQHGASPDMLSPIFFLGGASAFSCLAVLASDRSRRKSLSLRMQIERANEELKQVDAAKTRFFANVSHELRTPLTLLFTPIESLLKSDNDEKRATLYRSMQKNASRLLRQVEALLDLARLESGRLQLEPQRGTLTPILQELVEAAMPHARDRGVDIQAAGIEMLPSFTFDQEKVEVIAANLISNAVKFTPEGGQIIVRAGQLGDKVVFEVQDSGPGIPPDKLDKVFERFYQLDDSTSRSQEGTGLGLALARDLARLHGGDISASNASAGGALLRVELPLEPPISNEERRRQPRRRDDVAARVRTESAAALEYARSPWRTLLADVQLRPTEEEPRIETQSPSTGSEGRLLVVEDNFDLRTLLVRELSDSFEVLAASDGEQGLAAAEREHPDLILSDVMMPRMDGFEMCRRIREHPAIAATPIILLTAKAGTEALIEGLEGGADDYVTKPFGLSELRARIRAILRARRTEARLHEREHRLAMIGKVTSNYLDELHDPLSLVTGYADLAREMVAENADQSTVIADIETLQQAAGRLRRMVQRIVDYAQGSPADLRLETVPAFEFLASTTRIPLEDLHERDIECSFLNDVPTECRIQLDPERIEGAIESLVLNARDRVAAITHGRVALSSNVEGDQLLLRVEDNGSSVQAGDEWAVASGMGVTMSRDIVSAHGGSIEIEPVTVDRGARIVLSLPLD